ncbi:MAG: SPFH domain-containing protein [Chloroflexota bacterium]|nr:SPFH domain-containing protein [Chloroflexota bacterium]MDQ5864637.1 SPFH domain-containing protein [Chloroflexota bacterium]
MWIVSLVRKVGPNQALIIYGLGTGTQPKVVKGGGVVVMPLLQSARELSLELMSFDVAPTQDLYTRQGVAVNVEAVAQIKVKSDPESIRTAAEQLLTKTPAEREGLIRLVMEGHLRGIVGQLTIEEIVKQPEMVADRQRSNAADDMDKMGLEIISFTIREVRDKNEYITNMGRPDVARIKREADIATAEAERDTAIKRAQAQREAAIAKAEADQHRVMAETASAAKQAEAQRDLEMKKADYMSSVRKQQAIADKTYDIQASIMQQQVAAEQVRIERIQREEQVKVQDAEIQRRERELVATVLKPAEVERQRIEALAGAERQRRILEAEGAAEAQKLQGQGQAEANRNVGLADAEIIRAKGEAEADAMQKRADAFLQYNQAAILDKLLTGLPEVARAIAGPLNNVDKITIISTGGDGKGAGANQITADVARMIAQVPELFETLTGVKVGDLLGQITGLQPHGTNGTATTNGAATDGAARKVIEGNATAIQPKSE